jgi:hypothetical protein
MRHVLSGLVATAFVFAAAWLAWLALSPRRAIRVRNAFLLRRGREEDFSWTPADPPHDYHVEAAQAQPPAEIQSALREAGVMALADDWSRARAIVTMLVSHRQTTDAIRADLATTFQRIRGGSGYCADYVRVFVAAASGVGLFCRQWAFSFDGFGGHGHTFVEVFDRSRGAWTFLDVHNNVYAVRAGSRVPLSALELRRAIQQSPTDLQFPRAGQGPVGYRHSDKLLEYYRRGAAEWYLWWGNDVITRDSTKLPRRLAQLFGPLRHRMRSAMWGLPPIVALYTPENAPSIEGMERLRWSVLVAVVAFVIFGLLLLAPRVPDFLSVIRNA